PRISRRAAVIVRTARIPTLAGAAVTVERSALGTPLLTAIGVEVTAARLAPEKARVKVPVAPPNARSTKLASPLASVGRVSWPESVPPVGPLAIATVTAMPAWATGLPALSRSCTCGWVLSSWPMTADVDGWVVIEGWPALPVVGGGGGGNGGARASR